MRQIHHEQEPSSTDRPAYLHTRPLLALFEEHTPCHPGSTIIASIFRATAAAAAFLRLIRHPPQQPLSTCTPSASRPRLRFQCAPASTPSFETAADASHDCTARRLRCSVKVARDTSSVLITSADSGDADEYVDEGLSLASRKRA